MKKNLLMALEDANSELASKNPVRIDSELMNHIAGGKSSGNVCTVSGECNESGNSCSSYWDTLMDLLDSISRFNRDTAKA